jgi:hypothetical protein
VGQRAHLALRLSQAPLDPGPQAACRQGQSSAVIPRRAETHRLNVLLAVVLRPSFVPVQVGFRKAHAGGVWGGVWGGVGGILNCTARGSPCAHPGTGLPQRQTPPASAADSPQP